MASEIAIRAALIGAFPGLGDTAFEVTSDDTPIYNCIAWAAGVNHQYWWPGRFWPKTAERKATRESFIQAFASRDYAVCEDAELEQGFEKVALYEKDGMPTHAARQLSDGDWTSKLGGAHDISHDLNALNGDRYGEPVLFLKRKIKKAKR